MFAPDGKPFILDDPVNLTRQLIRCPSITPQESGCFDLLEEWLTRLDFQCRRFYFGPDRIPNFFAWRGRGRPRLAFAGHVDVVPVGNKSKWRFPPFSATSADDMLYGRGAVDMKGAIACFIAALARLDQQVTVQSLFPRTNTAKDGSLVLFITADEEGIARYGTRALLQFLAREWPKTADSKTPNHFSRAVGNPDDVTFGFDLCITGEPSNSDHMGQHVKIGRRGSWSASIRVVGELQHIAYSKPENNALHQLGQIISALGTYDWQDGTDHFAPSCLHVYDVRTEPAVSNQTPAMAEAYLNIRFSPVQNPSGIKNLLEHIVKTTLEPYPDARWNISVLQSSDCFVFPPGKGFQLVHDACARICQTNISASTHGGTSDSRFLKDYGEVIDFGLVSKTMHQINERVPHTDLTTLTELYSHIVRNFFATG